jgi:DNA mismatch repair protein MutS2
MSQLSGSLQELFGKLDLLGHIQKLEHFFSRTQSIALEGDQERHFRYIEALDKLEFNAHLKVSLLRGLSIISKNRVSCALKISLN